MNRVIMIFLVLLLSVSAVPENNISYINKEEANKTLNNFITLLNSSGYIMDSKSTKGWIRVLNSKKKIYEYDIHIEEKNRKKIIIYLNLKIK